MALASTIRASVGSRGVEGETEVGKVLGPATFEQICEQGDGASSEADHRHLGVEIGSDQPNGLGNVADLIDLELPQRGYLPDRVRDQLRPGIELDLHPHGRQRGHDVGKDDGGVEREAPHRLERDLGSDGRSPHCHLERVAAAQLPVFRQIPSGLSHHPDRWPVERLASQGSEKPHRCRLHDRLGQGVDGHVEGPVEMGFHEEPGLERRRREQHATVPCGMEETSEQILVQGIEVVPARHRLDAEEHTDHASDVVDQHQVSPWPTSRRPRRFSIVSPARSKSSYRPGFDIR